MLRLTLVALAVVALASATLASASLFGRGADLVNNNYHRGDVNPAHSLEAPFVHTEWFLEDGVPHWEIGADAVATAEYLRLTPNLPSRWGYAWNTVPNEHKWWEATVTFNIRSRSSPGADGMGFWYVERPHKGLKPGPVMGMAGNFHGLGILLDSYDNDGGRDNPAIAAITALEAEPRASWDIEADFARTAALRCQYDYRRSSSGANELIVAYHQNRLTVRLRQVTSRMETNCGEVANIELGTGWYFGFTAVTGGVSDNHDVLSFILRPIGDSATASGTSDPKFDHGNDKREKTFWASKD